MTLLYTVAMSVARATLIAFLFLAQFYVFPYLWKKTRRPVLESFEKRKRDYILRFSDGSAYRGDCTVWHTYPDGRRCWTMTESWLAEEWEKIRWKDQDEL
jgi:hypothetical protein